MRLWFDVLRGVWLVGGTVALLLMLATGCSSERSSGAGDEAVASGFLARDADRPRAAELARLESQASRSGPAAAVGQLDARALYPATLATCIEPRRRAYLEQRMQHVGRGTLRHFDGDVDRAVAAVPVTCGVSSLMKGLLVSAADVPVPGSLGSIAAACRSVRAPAQARALLVRTCQRQVGHAALSLHERQLDPALAGCRALSVPLRRDCVEGVFREGFAPSLGSGKHLVRLSDPEYPCNVVRYGRHECYATQPYGMHARGMDLPAILRTCRTFIHAGAMTCLSSAGYRGSIGSTPEAMLDACAAADEDRMECMSGAFEQYLRSGRLRQAQAACMTIEDGLRHACLVTLVGAAAVVDDATYRAACASVQRVARVACTSERPAADPFSPRQLAVPTVGL